MNEQDSNVASPEAVRRWQEEARAWLAARRPRRSTDDAGWGEGSDGVPVFHDLPHDEEVRLIENAREWQREKFDAGYGALTIAKEFGGQELPAPYLHAFAEVEAEFDVPASTELLGVTVNLIAPTIATWGTEEQRERHVRAMLRTDELACQLFSEPEAGSDLAGVACRAERDGDEWVINGQKVWSSGATHAQCGELLARTDPSVPKHQGITAFLLPMDTPGVEVRPIRQMSGGASFSEVFLTDVRIPDSARLGEPGDGWKVALTTLGFERGAAGHRQVGGSWSRLLDLARHSDRMDDPHVRTLLADAWIETRVLDIVGQRISRALSQGEAPGAVGSLRKLLWSQNLMRYGDVATALLGSRLTADTQEWGTFAWGQHVLGAPGFRIAGGTDEIQRNIIGERVLGLPREPRVDKDGPFREVRARA